MNYDHLKTEIKSILEIVDKVPDKYKEQCFKVQFEQLLKNSKLSTYDSQLLKELWNRRYKDLVMAPGEPGGRLREARFVMQARVAAETRRLSLATTLASVVMCIATIIMAATAILDFLKPS